MSGDKQPSAVLNFLIGGLSGMFATTCVQPIDFVKVQLQIRGEGKKGGAGMGPLGIAKETISTYGVRRLYTGLDSALLRQATYTTARMGIFKTLMDMGAARSETGYVPFWQKSLFSLVAGGLGSVIGNPADLALIRMQADHTLPAEQRRNYTGVGNALTRIVKEEGVLALWRGSTPTVYRAMSINLGMLSTNEQAKDVLKSAFGVFPGLNIAASFIAGFFACVLSLPFDNVKTKYQRMAKNAEGKFAYSSFFDCFNKSMANEGFLGLYVGFPTYVIRIAPHAIITLLATGYLNETFNKPR